MSDHELIREEGFGRRTVLTVRVPDRMWDHGDGRVQVIKLVQGACPGCHQPWHDHTDGS